jgi:membrane protein implicated in regulation of membrane protease activity
MDFVIRLSPLTWLAIGLGLMAFEIILPGFVIFWFGVGGLITALLTLLNFFDTGNSQWVVFFLSSLALLSFWQFYLKKFFVKMVVDEVKDPMLNNLKGVVTKRIEPGNPGEVSLHDNFHGIKVWHATAESVLEAGTEIKVVEADGIKLLVIKN